MHGTATGQNNAGGGIMTKADLIAQLAEKAKLKKSEAAKALDALTEAIQETLGAGGKVTLTGFGAFETVKRGARKGRNPRTGKEIKIPASQAVKFKAGKGLKDAVK
jgi:DNA-binding protein HU-beta